LLLELLLGVAVGIAASLAAWWVVARAIRPRLWISPDISKLLDDRNPGT
jgi:hypothetical protein